MRSHVLLLLSGQLLVCGSLLSAQAPAPVGTWHAALVPVPDVEVRFALRLEGRRGSLTAFLVNGEHRTRFTSATWDGSLLVLDLAHLDARLTARLAGNGLEGTYTRTTSAGTVEVPFRADRRPPEVPRLAPRALSVNGEWGIEMGEGEKASRLVGSFRQDGARVTGTVREATGDWGPLHGTWDGSRLVLTVFDGVHVYRLTGALRPDGSLSGEFRSRASPPMPLTARRLGAGEERTYVPGGEGTVTARDPSAPFTFSFADENGTVVSSSDDRFAGRPMIVTISGTWCPNCNDEAPVLKELYDRYRGRGLEVVSLSFEYTADLERSRRQVKRFRERYGLAYPVLVAGSTKEARSSPVIAQLTGFEGYPTTLFLDRGHRVVKAHTGFDGPATGARFRALKRDLEKTIRLLLATKPR